MKEQSSSNNFPEYTFSTLEKAEVSKNPIQNSISSNNEGAMEEATLASSNIKGNLPQIMNSIHNEENNNFLCDDSSSEENDSSIKESQIPKKENKSTSIIKDYLELVEFNEVNEDILKKKITDEKNNLKKIKDNLDKIENKETLIFNIEKNLENNENIFAQRKILNNNDSFFRSIIFSYLEDIILNRKKNMFKFFIYKLFKVFEYNYFNTILKYYKFDSSQVKLYLIFIYNILFSEEKTSIENAFLYFIKIYNSEKNFESILILNLKYQIFIYLRKNENKIYSEENKIKIGNLLPNQYKSNEKYDFIKFYENNLLQLNKPIDEITKLVMPFILRKNLIIYNKKNNEISIELISPNKKENNIDNLYILFSNGSYFIIYSKEYFQKFEYILNNYSNVKNNVKEIMLTNTGSINEKKNSLRPIDEISKFNKKDEVKNIFNEGLSNIINNKDKNKNFDNNLKNNIRNNSNNNCNNNTNSKNNSKNNSNNELNNRNYSNDNFGKKENNYNNNDINNNKNNNNFTKKESKDINNDIRNNNQKNNNNNNCQIFNTDLNLNNKNANFNITIPKNQKTDWRPNTAHDLLKELCLRCKTLGKNESYCEKCFFEILITNIKFNYRSFVMNNTCILKKEKYSLDNKYIFFPNGNKKKFLEVINSDKYKENFKAKLIEIKSSLCLGCFEYIENNTEYIQNEKGKENIVKVMFKFPCGCIICSEKCLNNYINNIPKKEMSSYICSCGEDDDNIKLKYLLYFALSHNLKDFTKDILRIINNYMKNKCCICCKIQEKKNTLNIIEIEDKEINMIFKINKFKHLVCDFCVKKINSSKNNFIFCDLCSSKHTILNIKNINGEYKNNCIII